MSSPSSSSGSMQLRAGVAARAQRHPSNRPPAPVVVSPPRRLPVLNLNPEAPRFVPQNVQNVQLPPPPQFAMPAIPVMAPAPARRRLAANPPPQPNVQQPRHMPARRRFRAAREAPASTTTAVALDPAGEQLLKAIAEEQRVRSLRFVHNCDNPPSKGDKLPLPIEDYEYSLAAVRHHEELKLLGEVHLARTETRSLWPNRRRVEMLNQLKQWLERFYFEKDHLANLRQELKKRRNQLEADRKLLYSIGSMLRMTSVGSCGSSS